MGRYRFVGRHGQRRRGSQHREPRRPARNHAPPLPAHQDILDHLAGNQADHVADPEIGVHGRPRHARGGRILARHRRAGRIEHFEPRAVQLQQLPLSLGNDGDLRASLRTPPHQRHGGFHHRLQETTFPRLPHAGLRLQRRPQSGMGRSRLMDQEPERRYSRLLDGLVPCPSRLFVRRPLFPHRQHPPRRIVETARSKELRLVPGHFGIVETLLGEILPECRSQQGLRPREIPCRLG